MIDKLIESITKLGAPGREFWESDLEIGCENVLGQLAQDGFMDAWVGKRNGRQINILRRGLGLNGDGSLRQKKSDLKANEAPLLPYLLVQEFARFKIGEAVAEFARTLLDSELLDECSKGEEGFDTQALCFSVYQHDPQKLRGIHHLEKVYRTGFARMKMKDGPRRPKQPFDDFLKSAKVKALLLVFDKSKKDGRASELKDIMPNSGQLLVFIRRGFRPSSIVRGIEVVHGYQPEWIILEFFDAAKRVNISSQSVADSLEIANRIGSAYYGKACEYENESEITYARQLEQFLAKLKRAQDAQLTWVELVVGNTPLDGACGMKLTDPNSGPIGGAVIQFEKAIGNITAAIDSIESIKVGYCKKRVSLLFEKVDGADDEYVVRYSDHRLSPLERRAFEGYMRETHAIPVLSTEKRFKDKS